MERKIYKQLIDWKEKSAGKTALLIDGARRVGKSYIVEDFAKKNYKSYILIDFNRVDNSVKELFNSYLNDLDTFYMYLSTYFNVKLFERESLIIFDEVQLFPKARSAIKFLVQDGRYDFIETGSLVSIKTNIQEIVIPSEERHITLYPMDFEEFLQATDNAMMYDFIKKMWKQKKPMGQIMHRKAINLFRQYLVVGGMPQVVKTYIETKDFKQVDEIKRDILNLYRNDIIRHAKGSEIKVQSIFDEIPSALQRHERKFKLSSLQKNAKYRDYEDAFFWLSDSMIVNNCYNISEPSIGLKLNMERTTLKCYMGDTGLLISHTFDENEIVAEEIYKKLLFNKLEVNAGMIIENIVAQMLRCNGHKLYFYSNYDSIAENRMEIDFLISKSNITNRHNISPIEVKSGKNYTINSLNKFCKKYNEQLATPYVVHMDDYNEINGITYLPIYMVGLL